MARENDLILIIDVVDHLSSKQVEQLICDYGEEQKIIRVY